MGLGMSNGWVRDSDVAMICDDLARRLLAAEPPASIDVCSPLMAVWDSARSRAAVALCLLAGIENGEKEGERYDRMDALMDLDGFETNPDGLMDALRSLAFGA